MDYPLPDRLRKRIAKAMKNAGVTSDTLSFEIAKLVVRENRILRKAVSALKRSLLDAVEQEEEDYGSAVAAYAGEETCEHILTEILRKHVYHNSAEARKREAEVEQVIKEINEQDPPV